MVFMVPDILMYLAFKGLVYLAFPHNIMLRFDIECLV